MSEQATAAAPAMPVMTSEENEVKTGARAAFWSLAKGFWTGEAKRSAWFYMLVIAALVLINIGVQYALNRWNRFFFDALEKKNGGDVATGVWIFLVIAAVGILVMVLQVWSRMNFQAHWRRWMTARLAGDWLSGRKFYQMNIAAPQVDVPEFRMTDDVRAATEPVVDFAVGLSNAILMALVFIGVLYSVGGSLELFGVTIPAFFCLLVIAYAGLNSLLMIWVGRPLIKETEEKNAAEAASRFELVRLRENAESVALIGGEEDEKVSLFATLKTVLQRWKAVIKRQALVTFIVHGNSVIAPTLPLLLGAPKYLAGNLSLGELMQIAAAFMAVQGAFNWMVENYIRLAEWSASANRVGLLWQTLIAMNRDAEDASQIAVAEGEDERLHLKGVSVTQHQGKVMIHDADLQFMPGEKVLVKGASGSGKSTLIRAIAGLWPWGEGEVMLPKGARVAFVPQRPYLPIGTLRDAVLYPEPEGSIDDVAIREALSRCGLRHLAARLDDEERWDRVLSGGEQQRVAFARLLLQKPEVVIMDEATSALDEASQDSMMSLFCAELKHCMVLSVGHRPGLEEYHDRVIVLERTQRGAEISEKEDNERKPTLINYFSRLRRPLTAGRRGINPTPQAYNSHFV